MPRHRVARPHSVAHAIHIHHAALAVLDVGVELLLTQPTPELQPWKSLCLQHSLASPEGAQCCTVHQPGHDVILEFATDVSVSSKHNLSDLLWDGHPRCLQLRCLQSVGQHLYVAHLLQQCAPIFLVGIVQHSVKQPPQMIYTRMTGFSVTIHPWIKFYPGAHVPPLTVTIHPWINFDPGAQAPPLTVTIHPWIRCTCAAAGAPRASISPWTVPRPPTDSPQTVAHSLTSLPTKSVFGRRAVSRRPAPMLPPLTPGLPGPQSRLGRSHTHPETRPRQPDLVPHPSQQSRFSAPTNSTKNARFFRFLHVSLPILHRFSI